MHSILQSDVAECFVSEMYTLHTREASFEMVPWRVLRMLVVQRSR